MARDLTRRLLVFKFGCAALALAFLAVLLARDFNLKQVVSQALELLRSVGPTAFFVAMALLPAAGAPLSFFCLTAGSVFGPQLGTPLVILLSLSAIAANIALCHLLARRVLHPPLELLVKRLGYQIPRVNSRDATDLIVLLRVTPGLPFPLQNYLLGLAATPFLNYFVISCLIAFPLNTAIIIFGEALLQGRGRMAMVGLLLIMTAMVGIHLVRKRLRNKAVPTSTIERHQQEADDRAWPT